MQCLQPQILDWNQFQCMKLVARGHAVAATLALLIVDEYGEHHVGSSTVVPHSAKCTARNKARLQSVAKLCTLNSGQGQHNGCAVDNSSKHGVVATVRNALHAAIAEFRDQGGDESDRRLKHRTTPCDADVTPSRTEVKCSRSLSDVFASLIQ